MCRAFPGKGRFFKDCEFTEVKVIKIQLRCKYFVIKRGILVVKQGLVGKTLVCYVWLFVCIS